MPDRNFPLLQLESLDAASEILLLTYTMNSLFWGEWSFNNNYIYV